MAGWSKGRGLLGPLKPLIGSWQARDEQRSARCTRVFRPFGKSWIELDARWEMEKYGTYREIALLGPTAEGTLGFFSFTNDGKRSEGWLADGTDIHAQAVAFEADMPGGRARMVYWPAEDGEGFYFAVENKTKKGWSRFLRHHYRPAADVTPVV